MKKLITVSVRTHSIRFLDINNHQLKKSTSVNLQNSNSFHKKSYNKKQPLQVAATSLYKPEEQQARTLCLPKLQNSDVSSSLMKSFQKLTQNTHRKLSLPNSEGAFKLQFFIQDKQQSSPERTLILPHETNSLTTFANLATSYFSTSYNLWNHIYNRAAMLYVADKRQLKSLFNTENSDIRISLLLDDTDQHKTLAYGTTLRTYELEIPASWIHKLYSVNIEPYDKLPFFYFVDQHQLQILPKQYLIHDRQQNILRDKATSAPDTRALYDIKYSQSTNAKINLKLSYNALGSIGVNFIENKELIGYWLIKTDYGAYFFNYNIPWITAHFIFSYTLIYGNTFNKPQFSIVKKSTLSTFAYCNKKILIPAYYNKHNEPTPLEYRSFTDFIKKFGGKITADTLLTFIPIFTKVKFNNHTLISIIPKSLPVCAAFTKSTLESYKIYTDNNQQKNKEEISNLEYYIPHITGFIFAGICLTPLSSLKNKPLSQYLNKSLILLVQYTKMYLLTNLVVSLHSVSSNLTLAEEKSLSIIENISNTSYTIFSDAKEYLESIWGKVNNKAYAALSDALEQFKNLGTLLTPNANNIPDPIQTKLDEKYITDSLLSSFGNIIMNLTSTLKPNNIDQIESDDLLHKCHIGQTQSDDLFHKCHIDQTQSDDLFFHKCHIGQTQSDDLFQDYIPKTMPELMV